LKLRNIEQDLALLTGVIYTGGISSSLSQLLIDDKDILVRYHEYISDTKILMAMLVYIVAKRRGAAC
jgi:hypothetical protein